MAAVLGMAIVTGGQAQTTESGGVQFAASGQKSVLDCTAGQAQIAGSNNILTLTGACKKLSVLGSNNAITVALTEDAQVQLVGSNNKITWTTPSGRSPSIQELGSGNTVARGGRPGVDLA